MKGPMNRREIDCATFGAEVAGHYVVDGLLQGYEHATQRWESEPRWRPIRRMKLKIRADALLDAYFAVGHKLREQERLNRGYRDETP